MYVKIVLVKIARPSWYPLCVDIVSFTGGENFVALDLIVQHVHSQLEKVRIPTNCSDCVSVRELGREQDFAGSARLLCHGFLVFFSRT